MRSVLFTALALAGGAFALTQGIGVERSVSAARGAAEREAPRQTAERDRSGRKVVRVRGDQRGHFNIRARMNGRDTRVLLDTGASLVALNVSTARRLGIRPRRDEFTATVSTANGTVRAARVHIRSIRIGGISVENVEAVVLPDRALDGTLLGMAFLRRLHAFHVKRNTLTLEG